MLRDTTREAATIPGLTLRDEFSGNFPAMQMVRTGRLVRWFGKITFAFLVFSILAMFFVPWRQTARGVGTVTALDPQERPQPVLSPSKGVISWVAEDLREGSYVEQDQLLLRMTPFAAEGVEQLKAQILTAESKVELAKQAIENAKTNWERQIEGGKSLVNSLQQDVIGAERKWEQAKNEVEAYMAKLKNKENELRIAKRLLPQGLVSQQEYIAKLTAVEEAMNQTLQAENKQEELYAAMQSKREDVEAKKQDVTIKNQEAEQKYLAEQSKLETARKELIDLQNKRGEFDRLEVSAPKSGFIQQWDGLEGSDTIKEGDQLFVIVPDATELSVEMKVSGNDMPLIHEGDRVRLQFEGWPAVQFVGWPSVAVGTFGGKVSRVFPTDDGKGFFRVVVTADNHFEREDGWPDSRYLRQGVRANGWVLLKRVPLGYEIWRQLNGFPPVVADDEPGGTKQDKGSKVKLPKV